MYVRIMYDYVRNVVHANLFMYINVFVFLKLACI